MPSSQVKAAMGLREGSEGDEPPAPPGPPKLPAMPDWLKEYLRTHPLLNNEALFDLRMKVQEWIKDCEKQGLPLHL
jgi:hypothetical protein